MKKRQREFVFADVGPNLKAIKYLACSRRLSISAEALPAACALYLIRLDEFRGEGRATEYRFMQKRGNEGMRKLPLPSLHEFQCWNVNIRE